jgi:hypothetical protein
MTATGDAQSSVAVERITLAEMAADMRCMSRR